MRCDDYHRVNEFNLVIREETDSIDEIWRSYVALYFRFLEDAANAHSVFCPRVAARIWLKLILNTRSVPLPALSFSSEPSEWDRRVFQTPSGFLDRTDFVWTLGDLRPGTAYVMQVKVLFEQVSTILQSDVIEFSTRQPPQRESILGKYAVRRGVVSLDCLYAAQYCPNELLESQ